MVGLEIKLAVCYMGGFLRQFRRIANVSGEVGFDLFLETFMVSGLPLELLAKIALGEFETVVGFDNIVAEHATEIAHLTELACIWIRLDLRWQRDFLRKTTDEFSVDGVSFSQQSFGVGKVADSPKRGDANLNSCTKHGGEEEFFVATRAFASDPRMGELGEFLME